MIMERITGGNETTPAAFKLISKGECHVQLLSVPAFESFFQISYQPTLCFATTDLYDSVRESCQTLNEHILVEHYWRGVLHAREILSGTFHPGIVISWINAHIGYGLFADQDIQAGSLIGSYSGELQERPSCPHRPNYYCFGYGFGSFKTPFQINAENKGGLARFINHSEQPNLETIPVLIGGLLHITFFALEPILKGAQLTIHYGNDYWLRQGISPLFNS
jgi:uncharacterized protein